MPILNGSINQWGPAIHIKVMQTMHHVERLKESGRNYSAPIVILGLIDTGASMSALDTKIINRLDLAPRGIVSIHTPSTGPAYENRQSYDACFVLGETEATSLVLNREVIGSEFASQGFFALIGRDVLRHCRLVCDGPQERVTLEYGFEEGAS
jgi:hypothetical protein